jgi:hypothetical protein
LIEPTLEELDQKMREAETESHEVICQAAKISELMLLFDDFFFILGQKKMRVIVANFQNSPSEVPLYLGFILQTKSH